ncbi:class I SAM-dependent methyltransferase [Thermodesulfobacteriota bacterium]
MKQTLSNVLKRIPGRRTVRELKYYIPGIAQIKYLKQKYRNRMFKTPEEIFTYHYENNIWGDNESKSGHGSNTEYTKNIRAKLPKLISELCVSTVLDAPCGDYYWVNLMPWEGNINYIGGDIVQPLINNNIKQFSSDTVHFMYLDIIHDPIPNADIWLCRDCFIHLSNDDIFTTLNNFFKSNINYILLSNYPNQKMDRNTPTGSGRFYNLMFPSFNFPPPIQTIDDWIEGFPPVRNLSLWCKDDLYSALHNHRFTKHKY